MTKLKIDYSDARDWYVTGDKEENGYSYKANMDFKTSCEFNRKISGNS